MCYLGFEMCEKVASVEWLPYLTIYTLTTHGLGNN